MAAVLRPELAKVRSLGPPLRPLLPGRLGGRGDVLVEAEQVGWVVASFDRGQPIPSRARVGLAESRLAVVAEEVDIGAGVLLTQGGREVADPRLAHGSVGGAVVEG